MSSKRIRSPRRLCAVASLVLVTATPSLAVPVPSGPPVLVHEAPLGLDESRVASDPAGNFLVVWRESDVLRAQAFWSTGHAQGPSFQMSLQDPAFQVGGRTFGDDYLDVAADRAGNFVVAYNAKNTEPGELCRSRACIWTKRRDADGNVSPADFMVGDPRLFPYFGGDYNLTRRPELAADGEGSFIVAWEGFDAGTSPDGNTGVWARKLVSSGQVNGKQFRVNEIIDDYQGYQGNFDVAAAADGSFVVVWEDEGNEYGGVFFRRFDAAKNPLGPQIFVPDSGTIMPRVAQMPDGEFMIAWYSADRVDARIYDDAGVAIGPIFEVSSSADYPVEIAASPKGFIVVYDGDGVGSPVAGRAFEADGDPLGGEFTAGGDGYYADVGAADDGSFVVTWQDGRRIYAQRFQIDAPLPLEVPLVGKTLALKNKLPDDFERSVGTWKASGAEIVVPLRGEASDPRCNGFPPGTVKATVRFLSGTSGEDVTIPLPCEGWSATGSNKVKAVDRRGYKYKDGKRENGPCTTVNIKGTKSLTVTCKGKPGVASFEYDLQPGVSQGVVTAMLELGRYRYCAEFNPSSNGSDGKKYKGTSVGAPTACPPPLVPTPTPIPTATPVPTPTGMPGSASGAFVDGNPLF